MSEGSFDRVRNHHHRRDGAPENAGANGALRSDVPSPRRLGLEASPETIPEANAYVVEVAGQTVGIVARDESGSFRFHASVHRFNSLEGRTFKSPREAERAAHQLVRGGSKKSRPVVTRGRLAFALG